MGLSSQAHVKEGSMADGDKYHGSSGGTHTYSLAEKRSYCDFINDELKDDPDLSAFLPMDPTSDDLFNVISKGVLLCKLINQTFEDAIPKNKINLKPKNTYHVNENHDLCIAAASKIGCSVVNIGGKDLEAGTPHLTLGLVWQIIKRSLMYKIENMDLARLLAAQESLANVPPEQILLRWFNAHLKNAGHPRTVTNFSSDLQDGENYAVLLSSIAPDKISSDDLEKAFKETDLLARAEIVLEWAERLDCRKFVTAQDIVDGNPKLNLAFVASLFQKYPEIGPSKEDVAKELEVKLEEVEGRLADALLDKEALDAQLNKTRMDFDALSSEFNGLKLKLDESKNERDSLTKDKANLEQLIDNMTKDNSNIKDRISELKNKKSDLLSKLEDERQRKLELETELNKTKADMDAFRSESESKITQLKEQIESEQNARNKLQRELDTTLEEIEKTKQQSQENQAKLQSEIDNEIALRTRLESELETTLADLEEARRRVKEAEQTKEDLFKLLTDTLAELENTKAAAQATEAELRRQIAEQIAAREELERLLKEKTEQYELAMADWQKEREELLRRIKELEQELADLKAEMRMKLDAAEKDKEDALALSEAEMRKALADADAEKDRALDKVRLLLTGNQKQGYLYRYENTLVGMQWKKKFFVLRDNLLSWYSSEKRTQGQKPKGVIYCEEARMYEMDAAEVKRDFVFQIDTGTTRTNIAAESLEEMKEWMTEIRVAKKKKLGVKVVSDERTGKHSPRGMGKI